MTEDRSRTLSESTTTVRCFMGPIEVDIQTELRLVQESDAAAIADANGYMSTDEALRWIQAVLKYHASGEEVPCIIWSCGEAVGYVFLEIHDNREGSLHYGLSPRFRGRGIATSACAALVQYAFSEIGIKIMKIDVAISNKRSCLLAQLLGFVNTGTIPNAIEGDIARYRFTAEQWNKRIAST